MIPASRGIKPKNEPAFPSAGVGSELHVASRGMTLRDWFAGMTMQALLSGGSDYQSEYVARHAYEMADAMLAERERKKQGG